MNLFDAYRQAGERDLITRIGMDKRYRVPPQGTFIETMVAVSELLGYHDVFSDDWIVVQNKPIMPQAPLPEADRPPQPPQAGPHFPEIFVDDSGTIVLCPGCSGSDASKDGEYFICRSCGSVWRQ